MATHFNGGQNSQGRSGGFGSKSQPACKPGSVHRPCSRAATIHLGRGSHRASSNLPERRTRRRLAQAPCRSYSVLLPVGFTLPRLLPGARWALTPPFHPYRHAMRRAGGLLSVALSLRSPSPGVTRHRFSVKPGLSSSAAFRPLRQRSPGRLARGTCARAPSMSSELGAQ
jgi:hypothetical protein